MIRSILVGLDGSPFSKAAADLSIRWAERFSCRLVGLGIVDEPTIRKPAGLTIGGGYYKPLVDEKNLAEAQRKVDEFLKAFAERCSAAGVAAQRIEDVGLPAEEILIESQRHDLIVLGKQSYFHFETQEGPDETLADILYSAPRPVVTVPETLPEGQSVVIAFDGSVQAARALQAFVDAELWRDREISVVSVDPDESVANEWAARAAAYLQLHNITAQQRPQYSDGRPSAALLQLAKEVNTDLIVMGAYGRPTIKEFFFGSTTRRILRDTNIPLFLYH